MTLTVARRRPSCWLAVASVKPCARLPELMTIGDRLVFIGMMQDFGLSLDEVHGVLNAATKAEWKSIASQRLSALDEQIAQLQHARALLAAALLCRYDHPATDCAVMGAEIDRRLS